MIVYFPVINSKRCNTVFSQGITRMTQIISSTKIPDYSLTVLLTFVYV